MSILTPWRQRFAPPCLDLERSGRFDFTLLVGDCAIAAWLAFAQRAFLNQPPAAWGQIVLSAVLVALLAWLWRWHDLRRSLPTIAKGAAVGSTIAGGLLVLRLTGACTLTRGEILWLAATAAALLLVLRVAYRAARQLWPDRPGEILRWIAVGSAVLALVRPFCTADALGSGDADWYTMMLADFIAQWRAGTFPVWIGQSEFAFNGAVSPLRFAPWLQHWGAVLDLLTAHALQLTALKNATLVTAALVGGLVAYACFRAMLRPQPWLAALLAGLWLASPGVLAPLLAGDQYMTFMTLPFAAVAFSGVWRIWAHDDRRARLTLVAGLAGLWLSHPPIAMWMCLLAGGNYAAKIAIRGTWRREPWRLAAMAAAFLVLGSFPFLSVAALDDQLPLRTSGGDAYKEIVRVFPENFLPINPRRDGLEDYQLGYTAVGAIVVTLLLLLLAARPRGGLAFAVTALVFPIFVLPVPRITQAVWNALPGWLVAIDNIWPMQRLFLLWSATAFFGLAVVAGDPRVAGRRWLSRLLWVALLAGGAWSWHEAHQLAVITNSTRFPAARGDLLTNADNVLLSRYSYASFARAPAYASHSYMDPYLENRLLDRTSRRIIVTNASAAAPRLVPDDRSAGRAFPRLVQSGVFTGMSDNRSNYYNLNPPITLQPDTSYGLRLEFCEPGVHGVL